MKWTEKVVLPDRESNPGLPRDRRRSSPLDYRGLLKSKVAKSVLKHFSYCFGPKCPPLAAMFTWNCYFSKAMLIKCEAFLPCSVARGRGEGGKKQSFEPDLNQRPMDNCYTANYSPPLYQLSYRRYVMSEFKKRQKISLFWPLCFLELEQRILAVAGWVTCRGRSSDGRALA